MISSMYDCLSLPVQIFFIVFFSLLLLFYQCFSFSPLFLDITVFEGGYASNDLT